MKADAGPPRNLTPILLTFCISANKNSQLYLSLSAFSLLRRSLRVSSSRHAKSVIGPEFNLKNSAGIFLEFI